MPSTTYSTHLLFRRRSRIPETDGELRLTDWQPWVGIPPTETNQIGLFERWQKNSLRYLVPETGEVFNVPRQSVGGGG
jgi:hypothetical protein